jgi:hypothetical protein
MKLLDSFVSDLETTLRTEASRISITEYWNTNGPEEAGGKTIDEFFDEVCYCLTCGIYLIMTGRNSNFSVRLLPQLSEIPQ